MIQLTEQTLFADRYQFRRLLGRGGFSEVWLAVDKMTGLEIAVKVYAPGQGLDMDGMKDFCKELSQVYNLNHTNLVKPQHVDNWMGMPYLVMTYCPKGSCHRFVGTMTEKQIWKLLHDVASGLAYLHEQGIIHQDIKPDNILIDPQGNYVITDFGISVQSRSTLRKSMNIAAGSGTTAYMGPERFSADPTPLKASDIWSLGAAAYELLTGNAPFGEIGGGLQRSGADIPTIKQNISAELRMVLSKMLSINTWDRPTAEQLVKWTDNPNQIDLSGDPIPPKGTDTGTDTGSDTGTGTGRGIGIKKWIIGIVVVALCGGSIWGILELKKWIDQQNKKDMIEKAINIQIEIKKECENYIYALKFDDLNSLDASVKKLRELETFENEGKFAPYLKRKVLPDEMDNFRIQLTKLKMINQAKLDNEYANFDKKGPTYSNCLRRIQILNKVLKELEESKTYSPTDIHIISDDL